MPDNSIINEKTLKVNSLQSKSLNDFINSSLKLQKRNFKFIKRQDFILLKKKKLDEILRRG